MPKPSQLGGGLRAVRSRAWPLMLLLHIMPMAVKAQEHDDDHDHLHFSHPIVTESPSPDTKIRLDYIVTSIGDGVGLHENTVRLEGEYAFTRSVSLALVTPFTVRTAPSSERTSGIGDMELSVKAASLAYGERGILLGGGLSVGLPTGSDAKGIGSFHIIELEPFLDAGYKRNALELVGFTRLSSTFHRQPGEETERNLAFDLSALYRLHPRVEGLIELTTERPLIGVDAGLPQTLVAPGLKVYPFTNKQAMFGASFLLGTGAAHDQRSVLLSGFYHF